MMNFDYNARIGDLENLVNPPSRRSVLKGLAATTGLAIATGALLGGCANPRGYFHNYRLFVVTKKGSPDSNNYQMLGFVDTKNENDAFNYLVDHRNEVIKLVDEYTDPDTTIRFVQALYVQRDVEAAGQILYEALESNPEATKSLKELGVSVEEEIDNWAVVSIIANVASMGLGALVPLPLGVPPVTVSIQK